MTTLSAEPATPVTPAEAAVAAPRGAAGEARKFLKVAALCCVGLVITLLAVDAALGWHNAHMGGRRAIGREVYEAIAAARRPGPNVRTLYLGDSVARQLLRPGTEPRDDVRYVTSNFAISLAGQYYLLEDALRNCPDAREVNLVLVPMAWGHDLDSVYTRDYFCGHFHDWRHVADVWRLKRDVDLTATHASRWLLPNLLAQNAVRRPQGPEQTASPQPRAGALSRWLTPSGGEPVLEAIDALAPDPAPAPPPPPATGGAAAVSVSRVSRHYLERMRRLCADRGVRLRVLAGPCPDRQSFQDTAGVYDGPILYVDSARFRDASHIRLEYLDEVRRRWMQVQGLDPAAAPRANAP